MKRTLYLKLLIGYVIFGILGFLTIATFTSRQTLHYIKSDNISNLYRESNLLAGSYASNYYRGTMTLEDIKLHFQAVATYLDADIWVIDDDGTILINTNEDTSHEGSVETFLTHFLRKLYLFSLQ